MTGQDFWLTALFVSLAAMCGLLFALPLAAGVKPVGVDDLMKIRNVVEARISPAGARVAYVISEINLAKNVADSDVWLVKTRGGNLPPHPRARA